MASKKHYIITSITLGLIGAASAALIGVANMITRDKIIQNEKDKVESGIKGIFGNSSLVLQEFDKKDAGLEDYKYVEYVYSIGSDKDTEIGYAFRTTGSNMYGKISLIVGVEKASQSFMNLSIVTNEQTYASTLVDKYIDPLNDHTRDLDDVTCGATYGAKLVREMVNEAVDAAKELWKE